MSDDRPYTSSDVCHNIVCNEQIHIFIHFNLRKGIQPKDWKERSFIQVRIWQRRKTGTQENTFRYRLPVQQSCRKAALLKSGSLQVELSGIPYVGKSIFKTDRISFTKTQDVNENS